MNPDMNTNLVLKKYFELEITKNLITLQSLDIKSVKDMDLINNYIQLASETLHFCDFCGFDLDSKKSQKEQLFRLIQIFKKRRSEIYAEMQISSIKTAKEELNVE